MPVPTNTTPAQAAKSTSQKSVNVSVSSAEIAAAIERARTLRAVAIRDAIGSVFAWPRRFLLSTRSSGQDVSAHRVLSALTAIRASAEVLRDYPDLRPEERRRFAETVVAEQRRLEQMVGGMLASRKRRRPLPS